MNLSKKERSEIREMFGGKCAYCGIELPEKGWQVDHVEPVLRATKWVTDKNTGYGKIVSAGWVNFPNRDSKENLFPCCRACNIHKSCYALESWRKCLEDLTGVLQRNYPTYRHAVRFGHVIENRRPIVFWFEKWREDEK